MRKKYTIGVMVGNASAPHTRLLMEGIWESAKENDVNLVSFLGIHSSYYYRTYFGENLDEDFDYQFNTVYDYTRLFQVDALVVFYGNLANYLEINDKYAFLSRYDQVPIVLLEETDDTGKYPYVTVDNYLSMQRLVEHLIVEHGYRRFAFLAGPFGITDSENRFRAFLDTLEKYGLSFDPAFLQYGDFSECVEEQARRLLDLYPGYDALICANDLMAKTVYRECEKRGIVVGKDVAVTGFDDIPSAVYQDPPLTTVLQDSCSMGRTALYMAVKLCQGIPQQPFIMPGILKLRESCGCRGIRRTASGIPAGNAEVSFPSSLPDYVRAIAGGILYPGATEKARRKVYETLLRCLSMDLSSSRINPEFFASLEQLFEKDLIRSFSSPALSASLGDYLRKRLAALFQKADHYDEAVENLIDLWRGVDQMVSAKTLLEIEEEYLVFQQKSWLLPNITTDLLNHLHDDAYFYNNTLQKLAALGLSNSFLLLFREPVRHLPTEEWTCPEEMLLAASFTEGELLSYSPEDRPVFRAGSISLDRQNGETGNYCVFCLFSGELQYGILVAEIELSQLALSYLISTQVGNAMRYQHISKVKENTQTELEKLVAEINEKNEILNFLSEYDSLTGCLNRRGFMENALHLFHMKPGREAVLMVMDLDHLKEINDTFGHLEGDFALKECASILQSLAGNNGITGRIGGDEFLAMIIPDEPLPAEEIYARIQKDFEDFNAVSGKPYYVEASLGIISFVTSQVTITDLIQEADKVLYLNKKNRRPTPEKSG
ncbi:MAG: GGDEF domain-containing protein [Blautia sp.]|nr:GGDEF domain-containing protein [Blautia sp.]